MDPREQLGEILPTISQIVGNIEPHQMTNSTHCTDFDVSDILNHMITLGSSFAYAFRGETPPDAERPQADKSVVAAAFGQAMQELLSAVNSPGAMERTIDSPMGQMPGETFARLVAFDGLVHGWDLARAIEADYELTPEVIAAVHEFAEVALTDDMRDGDTFKDATAPPSNADPIARVAAFSGRTV